MLCPVGAKHSFSALKGHGMSAQGNAVNIPVRHALNVAVPLATPVIKRGIEFFHQVRFQHFGILTQRLNPVFDFLSIRELEFGEQAVGFLGREFLAFVPVGFFDRNPAGY